MLYKEEFKASAEEQAAFIEEHLADICASIQERIVSILLNKLKQAGLQTGIQTMCLAGGVSANSGLRSRFETTGKERNWHTFIPSFEYCTDNAGMIAITGYYKYLAGDFSSLDMSPGAKANW
jgi:N6-L-threonylcarbamoyladenine synthase